MRPTKRTVLLGSLATSAAAALASAAPRADTSAIAADLKTYIGFGAKNAGGKGDNEAGSWIQETLSKLGFAVERQPFDAPFLDVQAAQITRGETVAPLIPLAAGTLQTEAPLAPVALDGEFPSGAIAAIVLPYRRWSTATAPLIQNALKSAFAKGASAALLVTTGPTDEAIALNVPPDAPAYPGPVAVIAPKDFAALMKSAPSEKARLYFDAQPGRRSAFNVIATKRGGNAKRLVVSTPRSGWGICAGERGPGIAAFLDVARWLSRSNIAATLLCTSAHEFENMGGHLFLTERAPKPDVVRLWVHLGANLAARDWHETGRGLLPLPSADPQRILMASRDLLPAAEKAFSGLAGLERPYELSNEAQGELKEIYAAGHTRAIGAFGAHRFHHTAQDDERCVDATLVVPVAAAFRKLNASAMQ